MEIFDWNAQLAGVVPQDWLDTRGANVKMSLIDTGVNLNVHSLGHLDKVGRKFFVGKIGFTVVDHLGKDPVSDGSGSGGHGTELACAMAGKANPLLQDLVNGVAHNCDFTIIKARDNSGSVTMAKNILDAIDLSADLGIEIAVTAQALSMRRLEMEGISPQQVTRVVEKAKAAKMTLIVATENRSIGVPWDNLISRRFPNNLENAVNVAAAPADIGAVRNQIVQQKIHFLLGGFKGMTYDTGNNLANMDFSSSTAAAVFGGIAACCLSALKAGGGDSASLLDTLKNAASELGQATGNYPSPMLFKNF